MRRKTLILILLSALLTTFGTVAKNPFKSIKNSIDRKLNQPFDTVRDAKYWKRAMLHGKLNLNDTTVHYPKFLGFCVKVYKWGDRTFNSYDTAYVVGSGKNWKFMLKNNDWIDTYMGHFGRKKMPVAMNSNISTNVGAQIAFMALSTSYMIDIDNLVTGKATKHQKLEFSFTCVRVAFDAYFHKNTGNANIHWFGDYNDGKWIDKRFTGLSREAYGLYGYYFINNKRYAQAAAYCFSKFQKKSAGSLILGFHLSHQNVGMDFAKLDTAMQTFLPDTTRNYHFRYRDYSLLVGYGYNWVFRPNWLFNVTAMPSIGYRHSFPSSIEGRKDMLSASIRLKLALVRNRKNFFYGAHFVMDGHWYISHRYSFFNSVEDVTLTAGIRF